MSLDKDAFYFPHFSNARHDRKLRRVRKELGVEGYGIYFMILEILREQKGFKFPTEDIDLLSDEFGTTEAKVRAVICNYKLFQVDEDEHFFSYKFNEYLQPYLEGKQRKRISGIKGNLIKYGYATKEELASATDAEIIELNNNKKIKLVGCESHSESGTSRTASQNKTNKNKTKQIKTNNIITEIEKFECDSVLKEKLKEFYLYRKEIKKPIKTIRPFSSMIKNIGEEFVNADHLIKCIDVTMSKEWQGVKGEYVNVSKTNNKSINDILGYGD